MTLQNALTPTYVQMLGALSAWLGRPRHNGRAAGLRRF